MVASGALKGYDAVDPRNGMRYQVKVRQVVAPYFQPDLRGQRRLDDVPFDYLVGVLLDAAYTVVRGGP